MHHSIKWFVLAFAIGFLVPHSTGGFLLTDATEVPSDYDEYATVDLAMQAYHIYNNYVVNWYLDSLLNPDQAQSGYVSYPPEDSECEAFGTNVSSYCLAVILNDNLKQYEIYLAKHKDELAAQTNADGTDSGTITLDEALKSATEQRRTFEDQAKVSEDALDLTLALYNQVQIVYPVHKELDTLRSNLEDYLKNLANLRDVIEKYPSKFNGASTAQCK